MRLNTLPAFRYVQEVSQSSPRLCCIVFSHLVVRAFKLVFIGRPGQRHWPIRRIRDSCGNRPCKQKFTPVCYLMSVSVSMQAKDAPKLAKLALGVTTELIEIRSVVFHTVCEILGLSSTPAPHAFAFILSGGTLEARATQHANAGAQVIP
jgi:hypothetical protein